MSEAIVHIIDDDDAARDSLALLLETAGRPNRTYPSARDFLDLFHPGLRGCLLLDVRMPEMDGLELQTRLREAGSILPIIFITGHGLVATAVEAIKGGAVDFLLKPYAKPELLAAIDKALQLERERRETERERVELAARLATLTPREREVLAHLLHGQRTKAIAQELGLSPRTVEAYRASILDKLNFPSLQALFVSPLAQILRDATA